MELSIYHTLNHTPLLSFLVSLTLISGFYFIGEVICKKLGINYLIKHISIPKYQYILISVNVIFAIVYPLVLYFDNLAKYILTSLAVFLIFFGFFNIYINRNLILDIKIKKTDLLTKIILLTILLYFFISASPITSADSLDYHLLIGKGISSDGLLNISKLHFHSHLFGIGEIIIALGLTVGSEELNSIIQFTGLISLIGLLMKNKDKNLIIYLMGAPVLIFFLSTLKPQFFYIASNCLAFCLIFFVKKIRKRERTIIYSFAFFLLCISFLSKFSFILSLAILSFYIIIFSFKNRIQFKVCRNFFIIFFLFVSPILFWKINFYSSNIIDILLNPFPIDDPGMERFKQYLVNAGKGGNFFKGIIFPDNFNDITNSLGLAALSYLILLKSLKKNILPISAITIFLIISYFLAQPSSRFFFEPLIWTLLTLSYTRTAINVPRIFDYLIKLQFIIFFPAILYGAIALFPGVLSDNLRDKTLENYADGYTFFKWANNELDKLDYKDHVIVFHRSISFLNAKPISMDFIFFTDIGTKSYEIYKKELLKLNPKYLITPKENVWIKYFEDCNLKLIKHKKNVGNYTSRKPFSKGESYDGFLYQVNLNKKNCIKEIK